MCLKSKITKEDSFISNLKLDIDSFNNEFNIKLNKNKMIFLLEIFREYVRDNMSDVLSKSETEELFNTEQKLHTTFNKEQKELYEKWNSLNDDYFNKMIEQSFVYGVCTYKRFEKESDI